VANGWPHCVRAAGYYGDDVTEAVLEMACARGVQRQEVEQPGRGLLELLAYLRRQGRADEAGELAGRHLEWLMEAEESAWPRRKKVEEGSQDTDGTELGKVEFDPGWVEWNDGTVERLARGIHQHRGFGDMPLLAAALVEAGCTDKRILRHLREKMVHTRGCWVLRGLLGLDGD
jgi:hypothetical protein